MFTLLNWILLRRVYFAVHGWFYAKLMIHDETQKHMDFSPSFDTRVFKYSKEMTY